MASLLNERRIRAKLVTAYKIMNDHLILPPDLLPRDTNPRKTRPCNEVRVGTQNKLLEPQPRLNTTSKTFFYRVPSLWNNHVSPAQAQSQSIDSFKNHFMKH